MEDNNNVVLNFKAVCKSIKVPNNFLELKLDFLKVFNLEENNSFCFYYIFDNKDNNKSYIKDEQAFEEFVKNLKNDQNLTIFINELNEESKNNILGDNDIEKEIESIKQLLIKEEEISKKLKIDNTQYKEELCKLEAEINKEGENKKEYNLNKGKYLEEIKKKEEIINENKEKIKELKSLLLDKKNENVSLEKQNDIIKNKIGKKTEEINKLKNKQNEESESDKIKNNLNMNNEIQNKINDTENETEKIRLEIEEEIENSKILESKTNSLIDKIKKINKDKINYRKIHSFKNNKISKYSKTQIIENRLNNSSILNDEVIHQLENSKIIYNNKIIKRRNFINEFPKSFNESFDSCNKKDKNINKVSLEEEDFKEIIKDKYRAKILTKKQKKNDEIKELLLLNKSIKESDEKLDIISNDIELSKNRILNLKHINDELKNEFAQISSEIKYDINMMKESQKIDISKIFKQIDENNTSVLTDRYSPENEDNQNNKHKKGLDIFSTEKKISKSIFWSERIGDENCLLR